MRTATLCLAAILLALFDSGPVQAAPSKYMYETTLQAEGRDEPVMVEKACAGFATLCVQREVICVNSSPPRPLFAPVVYIHAEPCNGFAATNGYILRERPYLAPIVYRSNLAPCHRQLVRFSYR